MACNDCVGVNDCSKHQSLRQTIPQGRSVADFVQDTVSCRRGYGCNQNAVYEVPYRGE